MPNRKATETVKGASTYICTHLPNISIREHKTAGGVGLSGHIHHLAMRAMRIATKWKRKHKKFRKNRGNTKRTVKQMKKSHLKSIKMKFCIMKGSGWANAKKKTKPQLASL